MTTIDVRDLRPGFGRPHVFILGAGASRAAFPTDNKYGIQVPLMDDLFEVLELEPLLAEYHIEPVERNFEALYSTLDASREHPKLVQELEKRVFDYFAGLRLPDEPTLYDRLVLSLRPKDLIATFNWDPFLWQALCRNAVGVGSGALPRAVYLHGSVAVGYCTRHTVVSQGQRGGNCRHCGAPFEPSRLLYPVGEKDYTDDPRIDVSWQESHNDLKDAFLLTIFGYGAPKTDAKAVQLIKQSWGHRSNSVLHDVEIIDVRDEDDLTGSWRPFFSKSYYQIYSNFADSVAAQYPRRSGEVMRAHNLDREFVRRKEAPVDATFSELWEWHRPLIEQEQSFSEPGPKAGQVENG